MARPLFSCQRPTTFSAPVSLLSLPCRAPTTPCSLFTRGLHSHGEERHKREGGHSDPQLGPRCCPRDCSANPIPMSYGLPAYRNLSYLRSDHSRLPLPSVSTLPLPLWPQKLPIPLRPRACGTRALVYSAELGPTHPPPWVLGRTNYLLKCCSSLWRRWCRAAAS